MGKFYIKTFGCQMNVHDSEKMAGILAGASHAPTETPEHADVIIFNTCSIREKAEQKFYSSLGRLKNLKSEHPGVRIVVAGCIAQQESDAILKKAPFVDHVIGPRNIHKISDLISNSGRTVATMDNPGIAYENAAALRDSRVRAWVNIMYGCDNFCSYCIVPHTRGREVSRPHEDIIEEVRGLASTGYREICLLGQNVNSYRSGVDFPGLLEEVSEVPGIERIRFMTSHPRDLSGRLIAAMRDLAPMCEHLHLPLQSGSDAILRRMNRGYTYAEYAAKVRALRDAVPGIALTTDIIAGFPGETAEDHAHTMKALREIEYDGIFAFKFSPRPMTAAAAMDDTLDDEVKSFRLNEILALQDEITCRKNSLLEGRVVEVLTDRHPETGTIIGRTRTNKVVNFPEGGEPEEGRLVPALIERGCRHSLEGRIADEVHDTDARLQG